MTDPILSISLKNHVPKTSRKNDPEHKKKLCDLVLRKIDNLDEIKERCRGKKLSFDVCFNLYSGTDVEGRTNKDLDNLLKIFCDIFPDFTDKAKTVEGLGLIEDDRDDLIFEIKCKKKLVDIESEEGIDFSIYEYFES